MIGETILHYKVLEKIGEGGMGIVYKAEDTKLKREVAIKFLPDNITDINRNRFEIEARAAAALNHPNITTIYSIEEVVDSQRGRNAFIVMEYIDGIDLKEKIKSGKIKTEEAIDIAVQIAEGLESAHKKGIIHRDIKPQNIIITKDGKAKIMDFGLAKIKGENQLTQERSTIGTVAYMSPEQIRGEELDQRTDIWSFGVVLYEMLTGELPFKGEYEQATIYSILHNEVDLSNIPGDLFKILKRVFAKKASDRYQDPKELIEDLKNITDFETKSGFKRWSLKKKKLLQFGVFATIILIALFIYLLFNPFTPGTVEKKSIAILPFENIGKDAEAEPFVYGIHEGLLTELSRISDLLVISRTSVMKYAGTQKDIPTIAKELGVNTFLEGTVQKSDDRVRVTVQLIDGGNGVNLWAESYESELTAKNIFTIQSELTKEIAHKLEARLTPEERRAIEKTPTENLEAYQFYIRGRGLLEQRSEDGIRRSIEYFQRAIKLDSNYALAWTGFSDALSLLGWYGYTLPSSTPYPKFAAGRALELDPELAEAHASLGIFLSSTIQHDGPSALKELKRAVELKPNYAETYVWLAWVYLLLGQPEEAMQPAKKAAELDPLAPAFRVFLAETYLANDDLESALKEAIHARNLQSSYGLANFMEGLVLYHLGRLSEAESVLTKTLSLVPPNGKNPTRSQVHALIAVINISSGNKTKAKTILNQIDSSTDPFSAGIVYAVLGDEDAAFEIFEKLDNWDDWPMLSTRYFFPNVLKPLRNDTRFDKLMQKANISWGLNPDGSFPDIK